MTGAKEGFPEDFEDLIGVVGAEATGVVRAFFNPPALLLDEALELNRDFAKLYDSPNSSNLWLIVEAVLEAVRLILALRLNLAGGSPKLGGFCELTSEVGPSMLGGMLIGETTELKLEEPLYPTGEGHDLTGEVNSSGTCMTNWGGLKQDVTN